MAKVLVMDLFEELFAKQTQLSTDLRLTENVLQNYRKCLIKLSNSCVCDTSNAIKPELNDLEIQFNELKCIYENNAIESAVKKNAINDSNPGIDLSDNESNYSNHLLNDNSLDFGVESDSNADIDRKFRCDWTECGKRFKHKRSLFAHKRDKHRANDRPFGCDKCEQRFAYKQHLSQHLAKHSLREELEAKSQHNSSQLMCDWIGCGLTFSQNSDLTLHYSEHTGGKDYRIDRQNTEQLSHLEDNCITGEEFEPQTNGGIVKKVKCAAADCAKTFRKPCEMKLHFKRRHTNQRPFECNVCQKAFANQRDLVVHQKKHSKSNDSQTDYTVVNPNNLFVCNWSDCGLELKGRLELSAHMNEMHIQSKSFECEKCGKTFSIHLLLRRHLSRKHGIFADKTGINPKNFICDWKGCNESFDTNRNLTLHYNRVHTKEKPYKCDECDKRFPIERYLNYHKKRVHRKLILRKERTFVKRHSCLYPECPRIYAVASELADHMRSVHTNERPFECNFCGKTFAVEYYLRKHRSRVHRNDNTATTECLYVCNRNDCGLKFNRLYELSAHCRRQHQSSQPFKCSICEKWFARRPDLLKHRAVKHSTGGPVIANMKSTLFACDWPECGLKFEYEFRLTAHIRTVHTLEKPFQCQLCGHRFAMKSYLRKHELRSVKCSQTYKCQTCAYVAANSRERTQHYTANPNHKKYKCECGLTFTTNTQMTEHYYSRHALEKPYKCDEIDCNKEFATKRLLIGHKRFHNNVRPFTCEWPGCDVAFYTVDSLRGHRKVHTLGKDFVCDYPKCGKQYKYKQTLLSHKRSHESAKPYVCSWPACDRSFRLKIGLKAHQDKHEGIRSFQCRLNGCTSEGFYRKTNLDDHYLKVHKLTLKEVKLKLIEKSN